MTDCDETGKSRPSNMKYKIKRIFPVFSLLSCFWEFDIIFIAAKL
jgi:hypothetical protein